MQKINTFGSPFEQESQLMAHISGKRQWQATTYYFLSTEQIKVCKHGFATGSKVNKMRGKVLHWRNATTQNGGENLFSEICFQNSNQSIRFPATITSQTL